MKSYLIIGSVIGILGIVFFITSAQASINTISYQGTQQTQQPKHILMPLLDRYPYLTATQAADLYYRINGSPDPSFPFGTNHGRGLMPQYDSTTHSITLSMNPAERAYENYLSERGMSHT